MGGTAANIIIEKPQGVYFAAVAVALPTITGTLGSAITMTGWTDLGFVDPAAKIKISFSGNAVKVRPMGMEGDLKAIVTAKKAVIEFMGLEEDIDNYAIALGGGGAVASNEMPDGGDIECVYKTLAIVTTKVVYHFKKVAAVNDLVKEISDDAPAMPSFKLETFVEEAATAGERQWVICERTGA